MSNLYKNKQWHVDEKGLCSNDGDYFIAAKRLTESTRGRYDWPEQLAGKSWVDLRAFVKAYAFAMQHFHADHDAVMLSDCIDRAFDNLARATKFTIAVNRIHPEAAHSGISAEQLLAVGDIVEADDLPIEPASLPAMPSVPIMYDRLRTLQHRCEGLGNFMSGDNGATFRMMVHEINELLVP